MATVELRDIVSPGDRAAVMGLHRGPGQDQYLNSMEEIFEEADEEQRAMPRPWAVHDAGTGGLVVVARASHTPAASAGHQRDRNDEHVVLLVRRAERAAHGQVVRHLHQQLSDVHIKRLLWYPAGPCRVSEASIPGREPATRRARARLTQTYFP